MVPPSGTATPLYATLIGALCYPLIGALCYPLRLPICFPDGFQFEETASKFSGFQKVDCVYAANGNLPIEERCRLPLIRLGTEGSSIVTLHACRYLAKNMFIVTICFSSVMAKEHAWHVLGGHPDNPKCSSLGGTCRRMWPGDEFVTDDDKVYFSNIDPSIRDPSKPVVGGLILVTADGIGRAQWISAMVTLLATCCTQN